MTESDLAELNRKIAVMEASKTQEIESRALHGQCIAWDACSIPTWDWNNFDFRVKPVEPARLYRSALGGIYCAPEVEVVAEYIELTPEVKKALKLC